MKRSNFSRICQGKRSKAAGWVGAGLALAVSVGGCGAAPEANEGAAVCPPEDPTCDHLDAPCVADDEPASTLGPGSSPTGLTTDKTASGKYRIWPKGRIPYKIASSVGTTTKNRLLDAMKEWETKTQGVVRFEKATASDSTFLVVSGGSLPITNHVGYQSGSKSTIELRNPEYITVIRHELGHVLGLVHEQRRSDRSAYIQVKSANIVNSTLCKNQFSVCTDCTLINDYFVDSIMQYRTSDLSGCRTGPVLLKKDGSVINHTWLIRTKDVKAIWKLYGSPPTTTDAGAGGAGGTSGASGVAGAAGAAGDGGSAGSAGSAGQAGALGLAGSSSGWSGAGGDDSIPVADDPGAGGASDTTESADTTGGCSLRSEGRNPSSLLLTVLALGLAAARRRRADRQGGKR